MDGLFEIMIILAFFLLPVLEGILKKRKRKRGEVDVEAEAPSTPSGPEGREGEEPASSVEMIPEEYWEELMHGAPDPDEDPGGRDSTPREAEPWEEAEPADEAERAPGTWVSEPPESASTAEDGPDRADADLRTTPATEEEAGREALLRELAAGGVKGGRSRAAQLQGLRSGRSARRGQTSSAGAHPLVGGMDREAIRKAVVWREVLGPPVALRDDEP